MRSLIAVTLFAAPFLAFFAKADPTLQTWSALLHLGTSKPYISSENFYLSEDENHDSELQAHLAAFDSVKGAELACRFPARYYFLKQHFKLPNFALEDCKELSTFLAKAPADEIDLVFASESLTRPASAMGHSLLKLSGNNSEGQEVAHNISFFTRMDDVDPVTLVIQSFVTGKRGHYTLSPYEKTKNYYLYGEERNLFEYQLKLSEDQKKLLSLHLFELKEVEFNYFFHAFNCATLLRNILVVPFPDIAEVGHLWVTPLDMARFLRQEELIQKTSLRSTNAWQIKRLILENNAQIAMETTQANPATSKERYSQYLLLDAKNKYEFELGEKNKESFEKQESLLHEKYAAEIANYQVDLSHSHDPSLTTQDSSLGLVYAQTNKNSHLKLELLPVSHFLTNDLLGYEFESEVQLFSIQLGVFEHKPLRLLQFKPLSILSLTPHDPITGSWSTKIDTFYTDEENSIEKLYSVQFLRGKTLRVSSDLDLYLLLGVQANSMESGLLYAQFEAGAILREIFRMKTHLYTSQYTNFQGAAVSSLHLEHGIPVGPSSIKLKYQKRTKAEIEFESLGLGAHWIF